MGVELISGMGTFIVFFIKKVRNPVNFQEADVTRRVMGGKVFRKIIDDTFSFCTAASVR